MQQILPQNLNYKQVKPVGFPCQTKQQKFTPVSFNTSTTGVQSSDVIRFNISTDGFWDPYSAYIKLEVDVSGMDGVKDLTGIGCGSQQLDNSASSFINQLIIYKSGTEIERIEEYDTIAAILNDMNCSFDNRASRSFEGMNSQNTIGGYQYCNPDLNGGGSHIGYSPQVNNSISLVYSPQTQVSQSNVVNQAVGRYEFTLLQEDGRNTVQPVNGNTIYTKNVSGNYQPSQYGYRIPFCQQLSSTGFESVLSKNIIQLVNYKGKLHQPIFGDKQTFCIPLISGLLGVLMPKDSYKYIPMQALQELIIEFRLSPYAMFTSGYADGASNNNSWNNTALNTVTYPMLSRSWRITKFEINVEIQYFDPSITNIILSQLNTDKGIVIASQSWMLGPRYQINANTSPNGTYQVNLGFESLKNLLFCFLPDDFQNYSFCRKQYRISANITSMYFKIGTEYYPPLPITGHAGCASAYQSILNETDLNNSEFLVQLYKTFGKFQDIQTNSIINAQNFSINQRAYDPTNTLALGNGIASTAYVNIDTTLSNPLFHENRCIGRAVYGINLESLNQDVTAISGINTISNRPFEITLKSDNTNSFTRNYTMYVFANYDMLIQLKSNGIQVLGRG